MNFFIFSEMKQYSISDLKVTLHFPPTIFLDPPNNVGNINHKFISRIVLEHYYVSVCVVTNLNHIVVDNSTRLQLSSLYKQGGSDLKSNQGNFIWFLFAARETSGTFCLIQHGSCLARNLSCSHILTWEICQNGCLFWTIKNCTLASGRQHFQAPTINQSFSNTTGATGPHISGQPRGYVNITFARTGQLLTWGEVNKLDPPPP